MKKHDKLYTQDELDSDVWYMEQFNRDGGTSNSKKLKHKDNPALEDTIAPPEPKLVSYNDSDALVNSAMCLTCLLPKKKVFIEARHNRNICLDCYLKGGCLGIGFKKKCKTCQTLWRCEDTPETECCADYILIAERIIYMGCKCTGNQKKLCCLIASSCIYETEATY